ncbi:MAG: hypothetical protein ACYSWP_11530, partial [Planctomycetota bacterium]
PDPVGGHLVLIRETIDARVLLGCLIDKSGRLHEWLELWLQNTEFLINTVSACRQSISNKTLDQQWHRQAQAFEKLDEQAIIMTAWETENPLPTFLDISTLSPIHPCDTNSSEQWKLCKDEGLLQQKQLPNYCSSIHRYLYLPASGPDSHFIPVTPGAPTNDYTKPISEICGDSSKFIPLNPSAGLMMVKKHEPIALETFIDILNGAKWDGIKHGRSVLDIDEKLYALSKDRNFSCEQGRLFLETHGMCGRFIETFHLKLRLLADIVSSVHAMVSQLNRPMLNICPENWQVKIGEYGRGLPFLWTATALIADPGDAIKLAIEKSDFQYYLPALTTGTSVYRPIVTSMTTRGNASVRIREVLPDTGDTTIVEGTFTTRERIDVAGFDLISFQLNLTHGSVNLYGRLEENSAMATGEWRFRTVGQKFGDVIVSDLRSAQGVPMHGIPFEIIPLLSSPCDMYSLAVMAVRILLNDDKTTLPVAIDETLSLSRQVNMDSDSSANLETRIRNTFANDNRWLESLGPQHLTFDKITAEDALGLIPNELWWAALAIILRMFPGADPESECKNYGDAKPGGLHKVFERTITDLDNLILRSRSLIVADWKSNQEIAAVIQEYLK